MASIEIQYFTNKMKPVFFGRVRARRIMSLGRFLVQPIHLLPSGPRLTRMWLILDLARNRSLDSENQDTIGNSFCSRCLWFEWQLFLGGFNFLVPSLCVILPEPAIHPPHQLALKALSAHWQNNFTYFFSPGQRQPHFCIQLSFTLPTFDVISILFHTPYLPCFCLVLSSVFITELDVKLYNIFSPCNWHVFR